MDDLTHQNKQEVTQVAFQYLIPIITKYGITTHEETEALIAAFQAGVKFAAKEIEALHGND